MREIHLGEETVAVQGSPWAAFVYGAEFTDPETGNSPDWYRDYQSMFDDEDSVSIDLPFLLRTCWAMAKNHDDATPPFKAWAKSLSCPYRIDAPWVREVLDAIRIELFRVEGKARADGEAGEVRKKAKRSGS